MDEDIERLRDESRRIEQVSLVAAENHYAAESPWYRYISRIGTLTAVLSAIASATAFKNLCHGFVAGIISLVVTILTAVTAALKPESRAALHHKMAKGYEALYNQAGYFYRVESLSHSLPVPDLEKRLRSLSDKFNDLNGQSPPVPGRSYRLAKKKLNESRGEVVKAQKEKAEEKTDNFQ